MPILMPRLQRPQAIFLLDQFLENPEWGQMAFAERMDAARNQVQYAAVGGERVRECDLEQIDRDGRQLAARNGFPGNGNQESRARFDFEMAVWLCDIPFFMSGEGLRDDVWSFVGVVLWPDLVSWRFPNRLRERYLGGVRNTFQRLWIRALVLDRGSVLQFEDRWVLLRELTEDAMVQIFERPSIAYDPSLARPLAEAWRRARHRYGSGRMEEIMRRATLLLRMRNATRLFAALPEAELSATLDGLFEEAAQHAPPDIPPQQQF